MWEVPKKYNTKCFINETETLVSEHVFEAINRDEAETRAYLNCINENHKKRNIHVLAERVFH